MWNREYFSVKFQGHTGGWAVIQHMGRPHGSGVGAMGCVSRSRKWIRGPGGLAMSKGRPAETLQ